MTETSALEHDETIEKVEVEIIHHWDAYGNAIEGFFVERSVNLGSVPTMIKNWNNEEVLSFLLDNDLILAETTLDELDINGTWEERFIDEASGFPLYTLRLTEHI